MKLAIIESPYAGDVERNLAYARRCVCDSLKRGEAPLASHLLYTQPGILNDAVPGERLLGIRAGLAWAAHADIHAFYTDLGWTDGMRKALEIGHRNGTEICMRALDGQAHEPPKEN